MIAHTMPGLVRLLCQPRVVYRSFRALPLIDLLAEPVDCDTQVTALLAAQGAVHGVGRLGTGQYQYSRVIVCGAVFVQLAVVQMPD